MKGPTSRRRRTRRTTTPPPPRPAHWGPAAPRAERALTSPSPHGVESQKLGRSSPSRTTLLGPHLGVGAGHGVAQYRAGARRRHSRPPGGRRRSGRRRRSAGSALTSSLFARATPSRSPKYSTCAMATLVTIPTSGRATSARRVMCPTPRAPISSTTHCASSGALRSVSGRPSSLLKERSLADVRKDDARHSRTRSLVVVLPTEPVIPTTPWPTRPRATRPRCIRAAEVSSTTTAVAPIGSRTSDRPEHRHAAQARRNRARRARPRWARRAARARIVRESMLAPSTETSGPTSSPPSWAASSEVENRTHALGGDCIASTDA